jgi:hypothetical protein
MTPDQVHILRSIFGNPDIELEHDGIVTFNGPVVAPTVQAGRWAVAQHNWDYNPDKTFTFTYPSGGGGMALVVCKEANDYKGNGTTGKSDITIYLPVTPGDDPNVAEDDVIPFFEMGDGIFMAPGFGDDRVGTIRQDINGDSGIAGWGVMNGTANAKANGGTALDIATSGQFLRQWAAVANNKTTGGAATDSVTVGSHSGSAVDSAVTVATHGVGTSGTGGAHTHTAASAGAHTHSTDSQGAHTHTTENVTVAPHAAHAHAIPTDNIAIGDGSSGTNLVGNSATTSDMGEMSHTAHDHEIDSQGGHTHTAASGGAHTHSTDDPGTHTHTTPALSHTITGSSALSHGAVTVDTVPPFIYVANLERLNNSRTGLGL